MRDDLQQLQRRAPFLTAADRNLLAGAYATQGMPQARRYLALANT